MKMRRKIMLTSSASSVEVWDTLPLSVLPSLRRRLKQSMRGKAMRSTKGREGSIKEKVLLMPGKGTHD